MQRKNLQEWLAFIDTLNVDETERKFLILQAHEMTAKDVTTTKPPIAVSCEQADELKPTAKILHLPNYTPQRSERKERNRQVYEDCLAHCRNCSGTCSKPIDQWTTVELFTKENGESAIRYKPCKFATKRNFLGAVKSSKIPARYLGKTFDDYDVDESNSDAVYFAQHLDEYNFGAYFFGECGTGKTFLASIIAQAFCDAGNSVIFVKVPSLLDDIKATFDGRGKELDILDEIQSAKLVVLDDFGMEKSTQWAGSTLCKIVDMRYDNPQALTIVTSNLSLEDLARHLNDASDGKNLNGSRIADRLREICKPILFKGTTRRN